MNNLQKATDRAKELRAEGKLVVLNPLEKAKKNPQSLRAAINAFCWECTGEMYKEVTNCTSYNCPLYKHRPWQEKRLQD